ncbi:26S proteasome non-ATPase regulatory subunit 9 isoform X2 [Cylas formicarius]|uniref:26S proteasome non-ATPase regulatory subunit 9 isoform X2 n=1 Tax=Cylas formicarius TaxID=197179 RepID=UPI002958CFF4|nr:26S proteasome non-ATPase regulatory subunit 9 isoform X2 [Cylas formicarius]
MKSGNLVLFYLKYNGVGMNDPLVDEEGFPVNSIDIYQVRHARHRIICLQNDHKNIMAQIENGLHDYYSIFSDNDVHESPMNTSSCHTDVIHVVPFARVTLVSEESPSKDAGIQANDEIVEFGSVNSTNFKDITDIALVVQHSEGNQISVKLKRGDHFRTVVLVPKKWSGKGLLGCNIVAL